MKIIHWMLISMLLLSCSFQAMGIQKQVLNSAQNLTYPVIVRAYFEQTSQLQSIVDNHDVWSINADQKFAVVQIHNKQALTEFLQQGLITRVDHKLTQTQRDQLNRIQVAKKSNNQGSGIPGFQCYSTVAETFEKMQQMKNNFPDLVELVDIGDSWEKIQNGSEGNDLQVIKLTNQNITNEKPILFIASSIHAREYTTAELNTRFAQYLLDNYGTHPDVTWILNHHEIQLSLLANPDGRERAQQGVLWRKNTNNNHCPDSNNRGVDLNRNYPFEWAVGGSNTACSNVYYGPSEASEPEVAAQVDYLRSIFADNRGPSPTDAAPDDATGIFIDIHSFSQLVLWPWGYTNDLPPNINQLRALGKRTALFNQYRPQPVNELVITGGGSIDAVYGELGVASLAFELGTSFFQDCASFESSILPDNLAALVYLARVTQAPYTQPLGPDIENLRIIPNVVSAETQLNISGIANDDRYNQSNGIQATETIQSVQAYINQLPINAAGGQNLNPTDGSFDSVSESFTGSMSSQTLTLGKNLIYLQASDAINAGATFSAFVDVVNATEVATLQGRVTDALTGLPIDGALLSINGSQAQSSKSGNYQQLVQPATAALKISAQGYASQVIENLNLTADTETQQNIQLQPFCELLSDDVEQGNQGWTAQSTWAISTELSNSPTHAWSDSPGGNYAAGVNSALTSPIINVKGADAISINYIDVCDTEAGFDFGLLEVNVDDSGWQLISQCDGNNTWTEKNESIELPNSADSLQFRFRLTADGFVETDGWYIDDISISAAGSVCSQFINDVIFYDGFE